MKKKEEFGLYGVFGYPLSHTLSPAMHDAAFQSLALKAHYAAFELHPDSFKKVFSGLDRFILNGFNLTVPFKQAIIPFLDSIDPEARLIGAVNTVYRKKNKWIGTNTDVKGFLLSLKQDAGFEPRGKQALVFGAGGAARAVLYGLAMNGIKNIVVMNRHIQRAEKMAAVFRKHFKKTCFSVMPLEEAALRNVFSQCGLVVNATSSGLNPADNLFFPARAIPKAGKKILFYDLIYRPAITNFMKAAHQKGHKAVGGIGMLFYQGAAAFEIWTGEKAPVSVMRKALGEALTKHEAA